MFDLAITNSLFALKKSALKDLAIKIRQRSSQVQLSITDTGGGIADDILPHIFDRHFTTKSEDRGSGIGLDTALKIMTGHRGTIEVETEVGRFTKFILTFPAADNPSHPAN